MRGWSLLLVACTGCSIGLDLDPRFAPRAVELPMDVPAGFWPPERFGLGPYQVTGIGTQTETEVELELGPVEASIGGNWRRYARVDGGALKGGTIDCVGPPNAWRSEDKVVHASIGHARLGCNLGDGKTTWALLYDVEIVGATDATGTYAAVLRDPGGRELRVQWARQTVRAGSEGGYYVLDGATIVAALDTTYLGAPRAYVANDLAPDLQPTIALTLATLYLMQQQP